MRFSDPIETQQYFLRKLKGIWSEMKKHWAQTADVLLRSGFLIFGLQVFENRYKLSQSPSHIMHVILPSGFRKISRDHYLSQHKIVELNEIPGCLSFSLT